MRGPQDNPNPIPNSVRKFRLTHAGTQMQHVRKANAAITKEKQILAAARKNVKDHENDSIVAWNQQKFGREWRGEGGFGKRAQKHKMTMDILKEGYDKQMRSYSHNKKAASDLDQKTLLGNAVFEDAFKRGDITFMREAHQNAVEDFYILGDKIYDKAFKDVPHEDKQRVLKHVSSYLPGPDLFETKWALKGKEDAEKAIQSNDRWWRNRKLQAELDEATDKYNTALDKYKSSHSEYYNWLWDDKGNPPKDIYWKTLTKPEDMKYDTLIHAALDNIID